MCDLIKEEFASGAEDIKPEFDELVFREGFGAQRSTPYFDALERYVDDGTIPFHVPGHQQGRGTPEAFRNFIKEKGLAADITQVLGLDDIHQPVDVCLHAHELAAQAYGSDMTFFLVNGSSSGNHVMLLSVCNPGDKIIVPRNCHKSVTGAVILSGVTPVYVEPEYDFEMNVDHAVTPESIEKAIIENPDAVAVMVLSPTYYGAAADTKAIAEIVHKHGKILMVDEAWGAHLRFHDDLPISAIEAGADIAINSTHKIISGMSQASMIHFKTDRIDQGRVHTVLRLFISTSPSCLLVSSLDVARMQMATEGKKLLTRTIELADYIRDSINAIPGMKCYGRELKGRPGVHDFDPTRIVFTAKEIGYTGYDMEKILRYDFNIQVELSDIFNNVALLTIGHDREMADRLINAIRQIASERKYPNSIEKIRQYTEKKGKRFELPDWPEHVMLPRDAFFAPYETVDFNKSVGRICCEIVTPYPPGIPILRPGDLITDEIVDYVNLELAGGAHIQGPVDFTLQTIRVVKK
ncbi:MAG: aminotransferase class I/II-fold pyridoxal phosphate-dependent enzyme [bacterium]|nr:aminotransferase class I/II-fold pyridoxal phosphate-dependent enzyme [bacterium]